MTGSVEPRVALAQQSMDCAPSWRESTSPSRPERGSSRLGAATHPENVRVLGMGGLMGPLLKIAILVLVLALVVFLVLWMTGVLAG